MTKLLIFIALFIFAVSSQLQAQMLIGLEDGRKLIGIVKDYDSANVIIDLISGKDTTVSTRSIISLDEVVAKISADDGKEYYGHIIRNTGDTVVLAVHHYDYPGGSGRHDINIFSPNLVFPPGSIAKIEYKVLDYFGKPDDIE